MDVFFMSQSAYIRQDLSRVKPAFFYRERDKNNATYPAKNGIIRGKQWTSLIVDIAMYF
jgi:hypothetical protein